MKTKPWLIAAFVAASVIGSAVAAEPQTYQLAPVSVKAPENPAHAPLTLEQIMADPDWLGRPAEGAYWADNNSQLYFQQKRQGSEIRDWYSVKAEQGAIATAVPMADWHLMGSAQTVYSQDGKSLAYLFEGNVFVKHQGKLTQVTRSSTRYDEVQFLADGRLVFRSGWTYQVLDLNTGALTELVSLKNAEKPAAPKVADTYMAQEQHQLIEFIALTHKNKTEKFEQQQLLASKIRLWHKLRCIWIKPSVLLQPACHLKAICFWLRSRTKLNGVIKPTLCQTTLRPQARSQQRRCVVVWRIRNLNLISCF